MQWREYWKDPPEPETVIFAAVAGKPGIYVGSIYENYECGGEFFQCMNMRNGSITILPAVDVQKWKPVFVDMELPEKADLMFQQLGYVKSAFVSGLYVKSGGDTGTRKIRVREDGSSWITENGEPACFTREEIAAVFHKTLEQGACKDYPYDEKDSSGLFEED